MRKRILLLITDLEIGGTPTVVRELATRLNDPPRVQIEVACLGEWGPVAQQLATARIPVTPLDAKSTRDFDVANRLVRLLQRGEFDTCFSFLVHANAVAAGASLRCRSVRFIQSIQTTQRDPLWHWHLQSVVQWACEKIVVPSASVARVARKWSHVDPKKIVIIPNAVEPGAFVRSTPAVATAVPRRAGVVRVGFLGRLDPIKRVQDLVRAMTLLEKRFVLEIFGDGEERVLLGTLVHELGLGDRVTFHGTIDRPQIAMDQIDLLVLPSAAEGFGLVLIEAMAAGVPVIGTDVDGIRDVVSHGENGLLARVRSPGAIAEAIRQINSDVPLREHIVARGLTEVCERYAWSAVILQYRRLLIVKSSRLRIEDRRSDAGE